MYEKLGEMEKAAHAFRRARQLQPKQVVEEKFIVDVTDGTLIQVIHSAGKGDDSHWVWSGFTARRLESE